MFKMIIAATILIASSASAGEIVWRSPTSGTLTAVSDPAPPPTEPEQPAFGIRYEPISVAAGTSVIIKPVVSLLVRHSYFTSCSIPIEVYSTTFTEH
ncbi:hypothetical protein GOC69_03450 [Sinorhizobium medicae]|nr:hypothetical protein [Sinorhizobium medicae]MDX0470998.1 hypothetical protein [Sinorhizobium medicae]